METNKHSPQFASIADCCALTGLSKYYLRNGCKNGSVPHITVGSKYLINVPLLLQRLNKASDCNDGDV